MRFVAGFRLFIKVCFDRSSRFRFFPPNVLKTAKFTFKKHRHNDLEKSGLVDDGIVVISMVLMTRQKMNLIVLRIHLCQLRRVMWDLKLIIARPHESDDENQTVRWS